MSGVCLIGIRRAHVYCGMSARANASFFLRLASKNYAKGNDKKRIKENFMGSTCDVTCMYFDVLLSGLSTGEETFQRSHRRN